MRADATASPSHVGLSGEVTRDVLVGVIEHAVRVRQTPVPQAEPPQHEPADSTTVSRFFSSALGARVTGEGSWEVVM